MLAILQTLPDLIRPSAARIQLCSVIAEVATYRYAFTPLGEFGSSQGAENLADATASFELRSPQDGSLGSEWLNTIYHLDMMLASSPTMEPDQSGLFQRMWNGDIRLKISHRLFMVSFPPRFPQLKRLTHMEQFAQPKDEVFHRKIPRSYNHLRHVHAWLTLNWTPLQSWFRETTWTATQYPHPSSRHSTQSGRPTLSMSPRSTLAAVGWSIRHTGETTCLDPSSRASSSYITRRTRVLGPAMSPRL